MFTNYAIAVALLPLLSAAPLAPVLISSIASPAPVGSLVTWSAKVASPQDNPLWYRFMVRAPDGARRIVKDFGPDGSFQWSPVEREGSYAIEVAIRNLTTGEQAETIVPFIVTSNVAGGKAVVNPTSHPLVFLYSAPACPLGSAMLVYFLNAQNGALQNTPSKRCDGLFSMNFYIAGLRGSSPYYLRHHLNTRGVLTEGPLLTLTSGPVPADVPGVSAVMSPAKSSSEQVLLASSLFTKFVATDLEGNTIWYYPDSILFLTHPEPGGTFFGLHENHAGDPAARYENRGQPQNPRPKR